MHLRALSGLQSLLGRFSYYDLSNWFMYIMIFAHIWVLPALLIGVPLVLISIHDHWSWISNSSTLGYSLKKRFKSNCLFWALVWNPFLNIIKNLLIIAFFNSFWLLEGKYWIHQWKVWKVFEVIIVRQTHIEPMANNFGFCSDFSLIKYS